LYHESEDLFAAFIRLQWLVIAINFAAEALQV
jgi:hypothetical protein